MERRAQTLIVGGGIAGLATAWSLARAGCAEVHLLERESKLGFWSSGRNAGILRSAIHAPATRKLALQSAARLRDLPEDLRAHAPGPVFDPIGLALSEGHAGCPLPLWLDDHQSAGEVEHIPGDSPRFGRSGFDPEGARHGWFPTALEGAARAAGVHIHTGAHAASFLFDAAGQVQGVQTQSGATWRADRVVLAPGAWVQPFARALGLEFPARTTRRHLFFAVPGADWDPSAPIVWDDSAGFYFLGTRNRELLISLCDGDDAEPDHLIADPLIARLAQRRARTSLERWSPLAWQRSLVGIRTVSEDDVPVVDRHPGQERLFWVAALGGHGITLSLGLGPFAAQCLMGHDPDPALRAALRFDHPDRRVQLVRDYAPL